MKSIFNPSVVQLGYVAMASSDLSRTRDHYADTIGLSVSEETGEAAYLSVGSNHHDIVLRHADEKAFLHLGYQIRSDIALPDFEKDRRAFGLDPVRKTDDQPGLSELVEVALPGGNVFQFFSDFTASGPGFRNASIAPLRLGHVAVVSPEAAKLREFYETVLGFHYADDIGGVATFLTCNRDHHVVNLVDLPKSRLHHVAFELLDNAGHVRASDILGAKGLPTLWGPSRHHAGHNLAAYHYDPDQVMLELYTQMDVYLPALGIYEPRPWHTETPMRPKSWAPEQMTFWETPYGFDLVEA